MKALKEKWSDLAFHYSSDGQLISKLWNEINHILATKVHIKMDDSDTALVLDFDLAILGENPDTYFDYTRKVRQEYAVYPNEIFNEGRKKVLRQFLSMPEIYKSRYFVDRFERQARQNLTEELQTIG